MMGVSLRWVMFAFVAAVATGCSSPCEQLAAITCEKVGENAPACTIAVEQAGNAGRTEQRACRRAHEIYEAAVNP